MAFVGQLSSRKDNRQFITARKREDGSGRMTLLRVTGTKPTNLTRLRKHLSLGRVSSRRDRQRLIAAAAAGIARRQRILGI
jgi:hypothetical protein